ncbi:MAG: ribosome biogenesis GTPase Der [Eubacteriaceae bacterium]|jgi:GTP-binding protein|nr:ribosome biogenesis GTPase Der [Eubacteriaceae bacterium]
MAKPMVAIIGRPNVGKSTLFNRLVGERIAIVEDTPGVTRDRIVADAEWTGHHFMLIDTGGIEPHSQDTILKQMRLQAQIAMEMADVIVFLVDGREGLLASDYDVADMLRKHKAPVLLAVNKLDHIRMEEEKFEFYNLGLGEPIAISAEQGLGLGDLLDLVVENLDEVYKEQPEEDITKVAVIGKPNVGKSTLINRLIGEDRLIVSDIPGTTRDAVDTDVIYEDKEYIFIDTAGLRKKSKIYENIERYSIVRAIASVERADVVVLLIDATQGVTEQDAKIAGISHNRNKPLVIVVNKWDAVEKDNRTVNEMTKQIRNNISFIDYAPIVFLSALTGQRVLKLFDEIAFVKTQSEKRITTGRLNEALAEFVMMKQPPLKSGRRLKIFYISQVSIKPPTFVIFVNDAKLMHFSYQRYLHNSINDTFDFYGTPIRILVRNKKEQ